MDSPWQPSECGMPQEAIAGDDDARRGPAAQAADSLAGHLRSTQKRLTTAMMVQMMKMANRDTMMTISGVLGG